MVGPDLNDLQGMAMWEGLALLLQFYSFTERSNAMRLNIKQIAVTLVIASLAAVTGCSSQVGASSTRTVVDTASDASWTPPGEDLAFNDSPRALHTAKSTTVEAMPQPNKQEVPKHKLHAAAY
jgi:hypothetical protein